MVSVIMIFAVNFFSSVKYAWLNFVSTIKFFLALIKQLISVIMIIAVLIIFNTATLGLDLTR